VIYLFLVIFYIVVNYSYGYIYFESPENTRIFYNAYDIQERLGLGRKILNLDFLMRKNYITYDDNLILFGISMSLFDDNNDWLLIVLLNIFFKNDDEKSLPTSPSLT
jgi:hypothetical protein